MALNCKQGDLAIVIRSNKGFIGKIVKCLSLARCNPLTGEAGWFTEPKLGGYHCIVDSALRPIRDSNETDEILRIVGKPIKNKVKA